MLQGTLSYLCFSCCRQGHIDIVIELLNTPKVNIDSVVPTNLSTALHGNFFACSIYRPAASYAGQDTTVALLLVKGANDALQNKDQLLAFQVIVTSCATQTQTRKPWAMSVRPSPSSRQKEYLAY